MSKQKLQKWKSFKNREPKNSTEIKTDTKKIIDLTASTIVLQKALEIACSCKNCEQWCFCDKTDTERCETERCIEFIKEAQKSILSRPDGVKEYLV